MLISEVKDIPSVPLAANSARDYELSKPGLVRLVKQSPDLWTVSDDEQRIILIAGIWAPAPIGHQELWVFVCEDFRRHLAANLRAVRPMIEQLVELYPFLFVRIEEWNEPAKKFARLFGFEPRTGADRDGYEIWKVR